MGPVDPLQLVGEIPRVAPSLRDPRLAPADPPGYHSRPVSPSPYATIPGLTPTAPTRYQVWSINIGNIDFFSRRYNERCGSGVSLLTLDPGSSPRPIPPPMLPPGASPQGKRPIQIQEDQGQTLASPVAPIPRAMVGPLPSTPTSKSRPGAVSPMASPLANPAYGKDVLPPPPPSPGQKSGSGFWSAMPGSPASRPGSFTFPGEAGEERSLVRQNSNQIQSQSGSGSQSHRHSTHSKDADRMSTCSSTSEQSIQSTQSNGVRLSPATCSAAPTNKEAGEA